MKMWILPWIGSAMLVSGAVAGVTQNDVRAAFGGVDGAFVLRDCSSGDEVVFAEKTADTAFGPCSTFKIWNSLIGLEEGLITDADAPFWKWDGKARDFPGWDRDQTWRTAFAVSCVPAFQELARRIGAGRMQAWLDKLGYGNRDMAGRPDAFWLPRPGKKTIMITPREQAEMICRLVSGKLPVKAESVAKLEDVMKAKATEKGTLYGKTGSGLRGGPNAPKSGADFDMGWWVGFIESGGKTYSYACLVLGEGLMGKDARRITETVFNRAGML